MSGAAGARHGKRARAAMEAPMPAPAAPAVSQPAAASQQIVDALSEELCCTIWCADTSMLAHAHEARALTMNIAFDSLPP